MECWVILGHFGIDFNGILVKHAVMYTLRSCCVLYLYVLWFCDVVLRVVLLCHVALLYCIVTWRIETQRTVI